MSLGLRNPKHFGQIASDGPTEMGIAALERPNAALYTNVVGSPSYAYLLALEPRDGFLRSGQNSVSL